VNVLNGDLEAIEGTCLQSWKILLQFSMNQHHMHDIGAGKQQALRQGKQPHQTLLLVTGTPNSAAATLCPVPGPEFCLNTATAAQLS
jgi:hypothetical protein